MEKPTATAARERLAPWWMIAAAALFAAGTTAVSWARWSDYGYRTFDLAFYAQSLHEMLRSRWHVSLLDVPLLGNHSDLIVFLLAPLFALVPHPMTLVAVQNLALATMAPVGWGIARRAGLENREATMLGFLLLLMPATGFVALHEFHPEAFTAPLGLLLLSAWQRRALGAFWLWFLLALACKINTALLLGALAVTIGLTREMWRRDLLVRWSLLPALVAGGWFIGFLVLLRPRMGPGNVDFAELYAQLGHSPVEILFSPVQRPAAFFGTLADAARGSLGWGLLLPLLGLPLLRPRWLLPILPILLQHALSWRRSEWDIHFHYAAPLIPFLWFATLQVVVRPPKPLSILARHQTAVIGALIAATAICQGWWGPIGVVIQDARKIAPGAELDHRLKTDLLKEIGPAQSVVAPFPYQSHLALRPELTSLHFILKGLRTLSRQPFAPPPPPDAVLIDYRDEATFDTDAGFYHPAEKLPDGQIVPPSDRLLHQFLEQATWQVTSVNEMTLYQRRAPEPAAPVATDTDAQAAPLFRFDESTELLSIRRSEEPVRAGMPLRIELAWRFPHERTTFPWLNLVLWQSGHPPQRFTKGLCAPEAPADGAVHRETWKLLPALAPGRYHAQALFYEHAADGIARLDQQAEWWMVPTSLVMDLGEVDIAPPAP